MIKVMVVDDSPSVQELLQFIFRMEPEIEVIRVVNDGQEALEALERVKPDVITMDIHMPRMDGFEATRQIMETSPVPIVIVSGSKEVDEVAFSFRAMEAGAVAVLERPPGLSNPGFAKAAQELIQTVRLMSEVKVVTRKPRPPKLASPSANGALLKNGSGIQLVAIGASTGGPPVLQQILAALPLDLPFPIFIVQHIAQGFTQGFAEWLAAATGFPLRIASQAEQARAGHAYLAPDGLHMEVQPGLRIWLSNDEPENHLRPSVSRLFRSVSRNYGADTVGVLLTGMGSDGAEELLRMRDMGAVTIAQDKESSLIHGMPGAAIAIGAATHILRPDAIAAFLAQLANKPQRR